jgi:prepilin peptidase CpaA
MRSGRRRVSDAITDMFLESSAGLIVGAIFTALLAVVARSDIAARRIPNALVLALIVTGAFVATSIFRQDVGLSGAAAGFALGLALWAPLWLMRVLGAGDVKLAAAIGTWLGPAGVLEASVLAAIAGGGLALLVLARRRRVAAVASGVALWTAALQRGQLTRPLVNDKMDVLPYGVALAVGGAISGWLPADWIVL